jgi:hypothetical protein
MQLPILAFIQAQLAETDPAFDTREGTAFYDLFIIPQQFMLQPLNDFMAERRVGQSVRQMLLDPTPDIPTTFVSTDADDMAGNLYVTRNTGSISSGTVRVEYITPKDLDYPALTAQFTAGTLNFFNSVDVTISASQMALQNDGSFFYVDIPIQAEQAGSAYGVGPGAITAFLNDSDAVLVTNIAATSASLDPQTNTQLLDQTANSIGVRDLETTKGINAILSELFPFLSEIVSIGMGDPEMQRDIVYNIHTGARTDVYLKTPSLTAGSTTINGLVTDTTRKVSYSSHLAVARNLADPTYPAYTGTPSIVVNSEVLKENVIETAASISSVAVPPAIGIDLTGHEWLRLQVDALGPFQMKISGAVVNQTQQFEIINAINAAFGIVVVAPGIGGQIAFVSPTIGAGSQIIFLPVVGPVISSENASQVLFGISIGSLPVTILGVTAAVYVNGVDYTVDYANGNIYQTSFTSGTRDPLSVGRQTIVSGQSMIPLLPASPPTTGNITVIGGTGYLDDSVSSQFLNDPLVHVRPGDQVTIISINGFSAGVVNGIPLPSTYSVSQVVTNQRLRLLGFNPTTTTSANTVSYSIVSQQVVSISYQFNPISIDIGAQVLLADGLSRGVRPGRAAYTITDTPFVIITSIQQVDPDTGELIGSPLIAPGGYGRGGYGQGGYGVGVSGDYNFFVNSPPERYSVFEDSMIIFPEAALSNSYIVNYLWNPELQGIHSITRNDAERVTGADVLVKVFIPCFVDIPIGIRRDPTNLTTPTDANLAVLVQNKVNLTVADTGLKASEINALLEAQGVSSVLNPFTMTGTVYNPDGTTTILSSEDILTVPTATLPSQTNNFSTARIVHFFPGNITVTEVP